MIFKAKPEETLKLYPFETFLPPCKKAQDKLQNDETMWKLPADSDTKASDYETILDTQDPVKPPDDYSLMSDPSQWSEELPDWIIVLSY